MIFAAAPLSPPPLTARFGLVLQSLRDVIAQRAATPGLQASPLLGLLWIWLGRLGRRFESIVTKPPRPRAGRHAPAKPADRPDAQKIGRPGLPHGARWIRAAIPGHLLPGCAAQLRHLLASPEMAGLLARDPRAVRLLRPLCRRLGIRQEPGLPACLFPPPRRRPPAPRPEPAAPVPPPPSVPSRFPRPRVRQYPRLPDLGERWPHLPMEHLPWRRGRWRSRLPHCPRKHQV